ncbi:hypothetical protein ACMATS_06150 [Streptoverticillium reticulum]
MADQQVSQEEHYEECYAPHEPCRCAAIDREEEAYREEPSDMFAREWGCY